MIRIPLTKGQVAFIDDADFDVIGGYRWHAKLSPNGMDFYARRSIYTPNGSKCVYMHREICGATDGALVDHADHNTLNNQRANLRVCSGCQNQANRRRTINRGFKGVFRLKNRDLWWSVIGHNRKQISLGYFKSETDAAIAYDSAAIELFGEFAFLNFPGLHTSSVRIVRSAAV